MPSCVYRLLTHPTKSRQMGTLGHNIHQYQIQYYIENINDISIYRYYHSVSFRKYTVDAKYIYLALVKSNVICTESTMTVEVEKSSFAGLHEDRLRLSDSTNTACSLQRNSNSTHIIAVIPLNACGTQIEVTQGHLSHCQCTLLSVINVAFPFH